MYPNLRAEMARRNISLQDIADGLGITRVALSNKINGKTFFTLPEARKVKQIIGIEMPIETLFEEEE